MTDSNPTARIFTRSEIGQFRVNFFADQAQTTPLAPLTPSYPAYIVYDLNNNPVQSGVGTMIQPGRYKAEFQIPKDAPLSYFQQAPQRYGDEGQGAPLTANGAGGGNGNRYRIEWQMVSTTNKQVSFVEEFDVRDIAVTQSLNRELKQIVLAGQPFPVHYRDAEIPYKAHMRLMLRGENDTPTLCLEYDQTVADLQPGVQQGLRVIKDGDSYVLVGEIPRGTTSINTAYVVLWEIYRTPLSMPENNFSHVIAVAPSIFPLVTSLRMMIDKFQKRLGRLQAYEDSDLIEYLSQGLRMVNLSYPTTAYSMQNVPDGLQPLILLAAGWWGLKAQSILETDLSFDFSGQSVTLRVDRAGGLDQAASNMMDMFNSQIEAAKMAYVRKAQGMGTVAGRAISYRHLNNYVYRVSSMGSDQLLSTLTKIGLL